MKKFAIIGMAACLLVAGARGAQGGTISLQPVSGSLQAFQTPATATPTINKNDVIPGLWGYLNGDLVLNGVAGAQYLVVFTLIGSESGWTNQLETPGGVLTEPNHINNTVSYLHTATGNANDFLKFQFATIAGSTQPILVNGVDPDGAANAFIANGGMNAPRTFFVSFCIDPAKTGAQQQSLACNVQNSASTGNVAWLALDDSGAGPNDNHDDWVGYVRVTAVPDGGATAGLLAGVLGCLTLLRKRFSE